jgi:DNA-binding NarL/FixJ family response regulator
VVDIRLPPDYSTEGLAAARVIQRDFPQTAVVVLSAHVEVDHAMDLLSIRHRTGYLLKSRVTERLLLAAMRPMALAGKMVE